MYSSLTIIQSHHIRQGTAHICVQKGNILNVSVKAAGCVPGVLPEEGGSGTHLCFVCLRR